MGKSKYQIKATKKIEHKQSHPKSRTHHYYDEEFLSSNKHKKNAAFAIFTIVTILIATGVVIGIQVNKNIEEKAAADLLLPGPGDYFSNDNNNEPTITSGIQPGDNVRLEYTLWVDFDGDGQVDTNNESPYQGPSQFDTEVSKTKLIRGFYYQILGMEEGQTKKFEIPGQLDENQDGIEDETNNELLGYGPSNPQLYNKLLVFKVTVIKIN
ncbi:MAG: FKBP-type peptidyl-prolyl cis-trans isomerase [Candidatus Lokiarchaeota archaeon]|nr:FKBP-type peptidyl-prolyl cis-trans isomerase [Candidatus Harpocratesius repetitus]